MTSLLVMEITGVIVAADDEGGGFEDGAESLSNPLAIQSKNLSFDEKFWPSRCSALSKGLVRRGVVEHRTKRLWWEDEDITSKHLLRVKTLGTKIEIIISDVIMLSLTDGTEWSSVPHQNQYAHRHPPKCWRDARPDYLDCTPHKVPNSPGTILDHSPLR